MSFRLLIGRAGTGKTQYCLKEIAQKQQQQKGRFLLLVPEQYSSQAHRELMEQTYSKSILQAEVLDFRKLAYRVFQKRGLGKTTLLGDIGKSMTLRKILNQKKKNWSILKIVWISKVLLSDYLLTYQNYFNTVLQYNS